MKKTLSKNRESRVSEQSHQKSRRFLALFTALYLPAAGIAMLPAMEAIRMFDPHGATENPATILLFLSFFSFPAVLLCSILLAWVFHVLEQFRRARLMLLPPLLNVLGAGCGLVWLQMAYDGLFGGKS